MELTRHPVNISHLINLTLIHLIFEEDEHPQSSDEKYYARIKNDNMQTFFTDSFVLVPSVSLMSL